MFGCNIITVESFVTPLYFIEEGNYEIISKSRN